MLPQPATMITKPPHNIAGDDHEEESPLLLRQEDSILEDSFQLEIISPTGTTTKGSLDENSRRQQQQKHHTPPSESTPPVGHVNDAIVHDTITSRRTRITLISLLVLFMVLLEFGMTFISTPLYQIQEDIICRQLLPGNNDHLTSPTSSSSIHIKLSINETETSPNLDTTPSESECKSSPLVQSEFSILNSWSVVLQLLPGLVMAVPMGLLADKHGRTLVMALSMAGMTLGYAFSVLVCSFPDFFGGSLRWTWLGSIFNFLGGGMTVFSAMVFSMLADVSGEGQRSTAFSYLTAGMHAGAIIAPPVTYWLMKVAGDWATVYVGLSILFLAVLFAICLPETLKRTNPSDDYYYQYSEGNLSTKTTNLTTRDLLPKIRASLLRCREFLRLLLRTNLLMLLASILLTTFGRDAQTVLMQYVTVKFGWSWGEAGLIQSIQSISTLLLLTALLPLASYFLLPTNHHHHHGLRRFRVSSRIKGPRSRDLILARTSILLQTLGAFLTGLAPSPGILIPSVVVSSFGQGFNILVRGLMTSLLLSSSSRFNSHSGSPHLGSQTRLPRNRDDDDDDDSEDVEEGPARAQAPGATYHGHGNGTDETSNKDIHILKDEQDTHIALLNSSIAWVETAGAMIATPLLAGSFRLGLNWAGDGGGFWTGLPFFLAGCLFAGASIIVLFVRVHEEDYNDAAMEFLFSA